MKRTILLLLLFGQSLLMIAQQQPGQIVAFTLTSPSIQNNKGGEDASRHISVYLPPGYDKSTQRYPVLYFLHGYTATDQDIVDWFALAKTMDDAIASKRIKPFIIVVPNSSNKFLGSFYVNSSVAGNWADFIARDLVAWTDKNFSYHRRQEEPWNIRPFNGWVWHIAHGDVIQRPIQYCLCA